MTWAEDCWYSRRTSFKRGLRFESAARKVTVRTGSFGTDWICESKLGSRSCVRSAERVRMVLTRTSRQASGSWSRSDAWITVVTVSIRYVESSGSSNGSCNGSALRSWDEIDVEVLKWTWQVVIVLLMFMLVFLILSRKRFKLIFAVSSAGGEVVGTNGMTQQQVAGLVYDHLVRKTIKQTYDFHGVRCDLCGCEEQI